MFSRILLASDGSDDANHAAKAAVSLARSLGAHLHVLHVFPLLPPSSGSAEAKPDAKASIKDKDGTLRDVVTHWAEESESVVERRVRQVLEKEVSPKVP